MDLCTFRFQAEIAFPSTRAADAVNEFAVDGKLDEPVYRDHIICIPFSSPFAAILDGLTPLPPRVIRHCFDSAHSKKFAVNVSDRWSLTILLVQLGPVQL